MSSCSDASGDDEDSLVCRLRTSQLLLRIRVFEQLYEDPSRADLAERWLRVWHMGEQLAACAQSASVSCRNVGPNGLGQVTFVFQQIAPESMAVPLRHFQSAFNREPQDAVRNDVWQWLAQTRHQPARLPSLKAAFHWHADAAEWELSFSDAITNCAR